VLVIATRRTARPDSRWVRRLGHRVLVAASARAGARGPRDRTRWPSPCADVCLPGRDGLVARRRGAQAVARHRGRDGHRLQDVGSQWPAYGGGVIATSSSRSAVDRLRRGRRRGGPWHRAALARANGREPFTARSPSGRQLKAALAALRIESRRRAERRSRDADDRDRALLEHSQRDGASRPRDRPRPRDERGPLPRSSWAALVHGDRTTGAARQRGRPSPGPSPPTITSWSGRVPTVGHELLRAVPFLAWRRSSSSPGTSGGTHGLPARPARRSRPARQPVPSPLRHFDSMTSLIGPQPRLPEAEALEELARCRDAVRPRSLVRCGPPGPRGAAVRAAALTGVPEAV